jgi:hypothetical protein
MKSREESNIYCKPPYIQTSVGDIKSLSSIVPSAEILIAGRVADEFESLSGLHLLRPIYNMDNLYK